MIRTADLTRVLDQLSSKLDGIPVAMIDQADASIRDDLRHNYGIRDDEEEVFLIGMVAGWLFVLNNLHGAGCWPADPIVRHTSGLGMAAIARRVKALAS